MVVAVVSDHGFGGAGTGVVHLNNWLAENAYLTFGRSRQSCLKRAALRWVPEGWRGALFRRFGDFSARLESRARLGGIDWSKTRAWSEELNYFPSIRVNLKGREPQGQVDPADYAAFVRELCAALERWDCVAHAWPRDEIYAGPQVERAPDIVLELAMDQGYTHSSLRGRGGPPFRRIGPEAYYGGKERGMAGTHRPEGILLTSEPIQAAYAALEDIAPAILARLGVPGPPMDGTSLWAAGAEQSALPITAAETPYTLEEEALVEARMRALGYFE